MQEKSSVVILCLNVDVLRFSNDAQLPHQDGLRPTNSIGLRLASIIGCFFLFGMFLIF